MLAEKERTMQDDSFVLGPGEGKAIRGSMFIKLRGEDTGGAVAIVEATLPPQTAGPPLHINTREDETFYVLEGTLRIQLGERILEAGAGSLAYVPKGSAHTFCNPYAEPVQFLGILSPAGFEKYFEDDGEIIDSTPEGQAPDLGKRIALAQSYGGVMVGPPIDLTR